MSWFESWFDSPYYHLLYCDRNQKEADEFISNLYDFLKIKKEDSILDLACGAGRHAIALSKKGNQVLGIDLSANSIHQAEKSRKLNNLDNVHFEVGDMRNFELNRKFDFVLNLFTSFGYFEDKSENQKVAIQIAKHQRKNGILVIDYLNSNALFHQEKSSTIKTVDNIEFHIEKYRDGDIFYKEIKFDHRGESYAFREQVQLFEKDELEQYFTNLGYRQLFHLGNYRLSSYHPESERSIHIFRLED